MPDTVQSIQEAITTLGTDVGLLHSWANGPASGAGSTVTISGQEVKTLSRIVLEASINGAGRYTFATVAAMNAINPGVVAATAEVDENKSIYRWSGSAWVYYGPNPDARLTAAEAAALAQTLRSDAMQSMLDVILRTMTNLRLGATSGKAWNDTGQLVTAVGRYATALFEVAPDTKLTRFGSAVTGGGFPPYSFFGADRAWLGNGYTTGSNSVDTYDLASAPAGTKYAAVSCTNATVEVYAYRPRLMETVRDLMFSVLGTPSDCKGQLSNRYFDKATGVFGNSSSWRLSQKIPVGPNSWLCAGAGLISETIATQAQVGFYGPSTTKAIQSITKPVPIAVSSWSWSGGQLTVNLASAHGWAVGDKITGIGNTPVAGNGVFTTQNGTTGSAVVIPMAADPGALTVAGSVYRNRTTIGSTAHGFVTGQLVAFDGGDMRQLTAKSLPVTVTNANAYTIDLDTYGYSNYTTGGSATGDPFLGSFNPKATWQPIRVADLYPTAASVMVAARNGETGPVYVLSPKDGYDLGLDEALSSLRIDWFAEGLVKGGRIDSDGTITQPTSDIWRHTDLIRVSPGQILHLTVTGATANGPTLGAFDESRAYIGPLVQLETNDACVDLPIQIPATAGYPARPVAFVQGHYRKDMSPNRLMGVRPSQAEAAAVTISGGLSYLAPDFAYGRIQNGVPEPVYLYAAGVLADRAVPLSWMPLTPADWTEYQGDYKCRVVRPVQGESAIRVQAFPPMGRVQIGDMKVRITDLDHAIDPTIPYNVIWVTDSTGAQLGVDPDSIDGDGTAINEASRQLSGVGTPALTVGAANTVPGTEQGPVIAADIRPAGAFNVIFLGTRGNGPVKHNGYPGWHLGSFLQRTNTFNLRVSAPLVAGNSISGQITDGVTVRTIGPVPWAGSSDATLAALATETQTVMRQYGTGTNPPTATVKDADELTIAPKFALRWIETSPGQWGAVTGGASQPVIDILGDGKINAFYDPDMPGFGPASDYRYSLTRYCATYGYDYHATLRPTGVRSDGSNLAVILGPFWNDYGDNTDAGTSGGHLAHLIDQSHRDYPGAIVIVLGLWAPPERHILKPNTGSVPRAYSPAEIFDQGPRAYGEAYRAVCNSSDRKLTATTGPTHFVQLSHQMDADSCFSRTSMPSGRCTNHADFKIVGPGDIIHQRARGYYQEACIVADVLAYLLLRNPAYDA